VNTLMLMSGLPCVRCTSVVHAGKDMYLTSFSHALDMDLRT
jgi:hypothetical protein